MKRSKSVLTRLNQKEKNKIGKAGWLILLFPVLTVVPNIALVFTECQPWLTALANVVLPLGFYASLVSLSRRPGWPVLCCLPFMVLAAFQIVLLFLYGESIIAVDMFLNVVTTNSREVGELLGNLLTAIGCVVVLYLPVIVAAIAAIARRWTVRDRFLTVYHRCAVAALAVGLCLTIAAVSSAPGFAIDTDIFPVNVIRNLVTAVKRGVASNHYPETSASFTYGATAPADTMAARQVYVLVIGETSRADNWQLMGYDRPTNPRLSRLDRLVAFTHALTQSNTTHKSVPMMLSSLTAADFDSITTRKGVISAFKEAGFATAFFSNQRRNGSYIDYFGCEADTVAFLKDDGLEHLDADLLPLVYARMADKSLRRQLIVVHTYGSHFNYRDRYADGFSRFTPDHTVDASLSHRDELVNAFDNSISYIDDYLASMMENLEAMDAEGCVLYAADHGEDIFDDSRHRFLHASPTPTSWQLRVPMLVWLSSGYAQARPGALTAMRGNAAKFVSPSVNLFHTLVDLAGLRMPAFSRTNSVASDSFVSPAKVYLTDRNRQVDLLESGLKQIDIDRLRRENILD